METKEVLFEMECGEEIEINVAWSYSFDAGCITALPEDCYPSYEETELLLPEDLDNTLTNHFIKNVLPKWRETVEKQATVMECDGKVSEWASDLAERYEYQNEDR